MTINTDITKDTIIALNNFTRAFETMEIHLKAGDDEFRKAFPGELSLIKKDTLKEIKEEGRISCCLKPLLKDEGPESEFLFAVHFEEAKLQTQMWFHPDHPQGPELLEKAKNLKFDTWNEEGFGIYLDRELDNFIDHSTSDEEIRAWFRESFEKFREFIEANPEVNWNDAIGSNSELV